MYEEFKAKCSLIYKQNMSVCNIKT